MFDLAHRKMKNDEMNTKGACQRSNGTENEIYELTLNEIAGFLATYMCENCEFAKRNLFDVHCSEFGSLIEKRNAIWPQLDGVHTFSFDINRQKCLKGNYKRQEITRKIIVVAEFS